MSQKSVTTTTSFIISSNESLNKTRLSSNQSTSSGDNMSANGSIQTANSQPFIPIDSLGNYNQENSSMVDQATTRLQKQNSSQSLPIPPHPDQSCILGMVDNNSTNQFIPPDSFQNSNLNVNYYSDKNNMREVAPTELQHYNAWNNQSHQRPSSLSSNGSTRAPSVNGTCISEIFQQKFNPHLDGSVIPTSTSTNCHQVEVNSPDHRLTSNGLYQQAATGSPSNLSQEINQSSPSHSGSNLIIKPDFKTSNPLMPLNVKGMLLHGVASDEVLNTWLSSIKCSEYLPNFLHHGYDVQLLVRMTPQDLTAIGCKSPAIRKKLLSEIKKLKLEDDIPHSRPVTLDQWLDQLKLAMYRRRLFEEGFDTIDKVCQLTWEDLEEIGINKLGHQKRLLLGIERLKKSENEHNDRLVDHNIYDVHPNHRMSLNPNNVDNRLSTMGRSTMRSGFFQTRSGANLDHRGLPVATVVPALKHVMSSVANLDISNPANMGDDNGRGINGFSSNGEVTMMHQSQMPHYSSSGEQSLNLSDMSTTMKRNPPPLPPVRTNSLKIGPNQLNDSLSIANNYNNNIYGNFHTTTSTNNGFNNQMQGTVNPTSNANMSFMHSSANPPVNPTSFLRTPKLGTLTATTTKMLTQGGHIQSVNGQSTQVRSMPIREAPPPPPQLALKEASMINTTMNVTNTGFVNGANCGTGLVGPTNIGPTNGLNGIEPLAVVIENRVHDDVEFPPPPPCQL